MNIELVIDLALIALYFVVVISIGLYKGRGDKTMQGFAIGDRNIPWWAVLASILAAEISAATFLGTPGEGYALRNFTYVQLAIGTVLARLIVSWIFIKPYYDYRVISIYEYLLLRFGVPSRNGASAVFLITRALASGTRLYVAAVILVLGYEMLSGFKPTASGELWIYVVALTIVTALTAVYTALGGIKAVVWTDLIQATIMFGALGFALWALLRGIPGGWAGAQAMLTAPDDLRVFDSGIKEGRGFLGNAHSILESEYTLWAAFLGSTFTTMATHGTDQDMVQRMLTAKNPARARLALVCSGLADIPLVIAFALVGILLWCFYQAHPDPNLPAKNAHVFAYYILHELPVGLRGLLVAGLFATAMGSLSTALNALATSFTEDWYRPYIRPNATQAQTLRAARWSTVGFAIVLIVIGALTAQLVIANPKSRIIPIVLGVFGYTYGSLLGVFLAGMLTRTRGNNRGNIVAMIAGFIVVSLLSGLHTDVAILCGMRPPIQPGEHPWPGITIEFPWRILFGTLVTFAIAICFRTPEEQLAKARAHLANLA